MKKISYSILLLVVCVLSGVTLSAQTLKGTIIDKKTKEPMVGVQIAINGTTVGTVTDLDGNYVLNKLFDGAVLSINYISYTTVITSPIAIKDGETKVMNFQMEESDITLDEVVITARKNYESEGVLKSERINSGFAIENIGAKEMSLKGISTVADGVQKMTGITIADAGQVFVRGLGDRYSITTLNGLPIASPNPDNKLIPLDIFPSSAVKNITVSKVYQVGAFADYSGAHIDIGTRETAEENFLQFSVSTGGKIGTLFNDFYKSDSRGLLGTNNLTDEIKAMSPSQFNTYVKTTNPFKTSFNVENRTALPDFSVNVASGNNWAVGTGELSLLLSGAVNSSQETIENGYVTTLTAQGSNLNEFTYNAYSKELRMAGLGTLGYAFRNGDRVNYTLFYARNSMDDYKRREGYDSEGINLIGSNSVYHVYALLNHQVSGVHKLTRRLQAVWSGSYGTTQSDEPDRRQIMFREDNGKLSLFKLNKQETMRYFGDLQEDEIVGDVKLKYTFGNDNFIRLGGVYKDKGREYSSTRFYYNLANINPEITDIYNTDTYLNYKNLSDGIVTINKDSQPKYSYNAGSTVHAAFAEMSLKPWTSFLVNVGVRYEDMKQWVEYWNDASVKKKSELNKADLFPALNLKFNFDNQNAMRLAFSRTITRPSFIEMAPFLYKESYGSAEVRGNENLLNGYNYNVDLRYEVFSAANSDMISLTGYYKYLESPIERVQESSGGAAVHSFRNAQDGMATGLEVELRKTMLHNLRFGFNASFMYTNVILPENAGIYTDSQRALQGASPYIVNADITYMPRLGEHSNMTLSLLYNLQGPRIQAVGIYGMSNIIQQERHLLDFVWNYTINDNWSIKAQCKNILNTKTIFTQEIGDTKDKVQVEHFKQGVGVQLGVSCKF
ncbi:MAG: carboxypeptidase-like regulatory domain-containing protein [Marinifilaceae bacterium]